MQPEIITPIRIIEMKKKTAFPIAYSNGSNYILKGGETQQEIKAKNHDVYNAHQQTRERSVSGVRI